MKLLGFTLLFLIFLTGCSGNQERIEFMQSSIGIFLPKDGTYLVKENRIDELSGGFSIVLVLELDLITEAILEKQINASYGRVETISTGDYLKSIKKERIAKFIKQWKKNKRGYFLQYKYDVNQLVVCNIDTVSHLLTYEFQHR